MQIFLNVPDCFQRFRYYIPEYFVNVFVVVCKAFYFSDAISLVRFERKPVLCRLVCISMNLVSRSVALTILINMNKSQLQSTTVCLRRSAESAWYITKTYWW